MREPLRLERTAPPAAPPVTLQEARAQLRLDADRVEEDAVLEALVRAATEACEAFTRRALIAQGWSLWLDVWPRAGARERLWEGVRVGAEAALLAPRRELALPRPPLLGVSAIVTYDDADQASAYAPANYVVDAASIPGRVVLRAGAAAPAPARAANGIEVRFTAGHGPDPADVPEALRQGIVRLAAHLFEHRGDDPAGRALADSGAAGLWARYRVEAL